MLWETKDIHFIVENLKAQVWVIPKTVTWSMHGWGTQKDYLILYFLDPLHLNMLLKLNDTFILKVWFY
jgi:hypothetical protein